MVKISHMDYVHCLEPWIKASEKYLYTPPERNDLVCYGTGYNGWGMQTHQKAFAAFAVLAADPGMNEENTGMSREQMMDTALKMFRFTLESHIEGSYECMDGTSWGHTWISSLGIERMMHGVEAIEEYLTEGDRELLKKVLISECDWLMDNYSIVAGPVDNNKPESNLWNGSVLFRTAVMYPEAPRADEYRKKGTKFLINSISAPSDAENSLMIDGKPVSEWYIGNNFFDSYALNHHGYLNVGYSIICLSNAAMLHFMYEKRKIKAPDALYIHINDLWKMVRNCFFPDGRLLRIGGDTRVRYCYCQDYAIPVWLMAEDILEDIDCAGLEAEWISILKKEMKNNGDGSFLSDRCSDLEKSAPIYYTRLESDRAVSLSYGAYWRRIFNDFLRDIEKPDSNIAAQNVEKPVISAVSWHDEYHGACYVRGEKRIASWTWRAGELPQGLCLPPDASDLAEWRYNLAGRVKGTGTYNYNKVISHKEQQFEGGFITYGSFISCSEELVSEQQTKDILALHKVVYAALPDDRTVAVMQFATAYMRSYLTSIQGLYLSIPNDLFNDNKRTYCYNDVERIIEGVGSKEEVINTKSSWINVDGKLSVVKVYGEEELSIYRPGRRQVGLKHKHQGDTMGMLYADEICTPFYKGLKSVDKGTVIIDTGFIVLSGADSDCSADYVSGGLCRELAITKMKSNELVLSGENSMIRSMMVRGDDGKNYIIAANMGEEPVNVAVIIPEWEAVYAETQDLISESKDVIPRLKAMCDVITKEKITLKDGILQISLTAGEARLFVEC